MILRYFLNTYIIEKLIAIVLNIRVQVGIYIHMYI
jgi:hypothetical protein